ncbi:alanine transaminase, partial [Spiromyces aspiralis]
MTVIADMSNNPLSSSPSSKVLDLETMNPHIREMGYAVRGAISICAEQIEREIRAPEDRAKYDFDTITYCNIGNPQQLGQKLLTFLRQVTVLAEYPELLKDENLPTTQKLFPADTIERAKMVFRWTDNAIGAYSASLGIHEIREDVAKFIEERDGYPSNPELIRLTADASVSVERLLNLIISGPEVGIMILIPQYLLYTTSIDKFNAHAVPCYLRDSEQWGLDVSELNQVLNEHRAKASTCAALSSSTLENMVEVIRFCEKNRLILMADEVYQANVYQPDVRPFHSFKKVVCELGSSVELFSLHSISKGMIGECGRRGGYYEVTNINTDIIAQLYKMATVSLCPNVQGQIALDIMVNPPKQGDPSYELYNAELNEIY